ncbi:MAG TPA: hypothetical protein VD993_12100 [Chitinophagaceae bacterium]|nr:hypothetical protein [Chitinophagaceae bacterium]
MNQKLHTLPTDELVNLLYQQRKKFLVAVDYGSTASDLQEIRESIKELETLIASRDPQPDVHTADTG